MVLVLGIVKASLEILGISIWVKKVVLLMSGGQVTLAARVAVLPGLPGSPGLPSLSSSVVTRMVMRLSSIQWLRGGRGGWSTPIPLYFNDAK